MFRSRMSLAQAVLGEGFKEDVEEAIGGQLLLRGGLKVLLPQMRQLDQRMLASLEPTIGVVDGVVTEASIHMLGAECSCSCSWTWDRGWDLKSYSALRRADALFVSVRCISP